MPLWAGSVHTPQCRWGGPPPSTASPEPLRSSIWSESLRSLTMVAAPLHRAWDGPADAGPLISTSLYPGARTATAPSQAMRYGDGGQCRDSHLLAPAWRGGGLTPSHLRLPVEADRRTGKDAGDVKRWRREWIDQNKTSSLHSFDSLMIVGA